MAFQSSKDRKLAFRNNSGVKQKYFNNELLKNLRFPFKLHWVFGLDTKVSPLNISSATIKQIFYATGSVGICFDWVQNTQTVMFGHVHSIVSTAVTSDKTYLASVDSGADNSLIIWNVRIGKMVYALSGYFPEGAVWMCFSEDGNILMTLSRSIPQQLSLWNWKANETCSFYIHNYKKEDEFQHYATFHPKDSTHFLSLSKRNIYFFKMDNGKISSSMLDLSNLYDEKAIKRAGDFTQTVFSSLSTLAVTGTTRGRIVLWDKPLCSKTKSDQTVPPCLTVGPKQRVCLRIMQLFTSNCSITFLGTDKEFLVVGTDQGKVCYYDEAFKMHWSIKTTQGPISVVSFNFMPRFTFKQAVMRALGKNIDHLVSKRNDFVMCTNTGYVGYVRTSSSDLCDVLLGTSFSVKAVDVHTSRPYMYFGDSCGGIQKWNYETKSLMCKEQYQSPSSEIKCISIDPNGNYIACGLLNGHVVIFDAVTLSAKPCFTSNDVKHRLTWLKFSPDPQHLIVTDELSNVFRYQLELLVPPAVYQMMNKENVPSEEPIWRLNGKTRQHNSHIIDRMFSRPEKDGNLFFFTLGEDCSVIQYNISNSKKRKIETKRLALEGVLFPKCMCWYPLYDLKESIAVISSDEKLYVFNMEDSKMIRMVSLSLYEEPFKVIVLKENPIIASEDANQNENLKKYFIFHTDHMIGLAKFPIDGNPNTSLAMASHPDGINTFVTNENQTFLFSAGRKDSWIYMYEVNLKAVLETEKEAGQGIDAFKCLFPANEDPGDLKRRLLYSIYSLELEMKLLAFGTDPEPVLKGEIPVNCLEYVMAALGCFLSSNDLQMMLNDIYFENLYMHDGKKSTLNCLDIVKLYVNYRPKDPLTKKKIKEAFNKIISSEEDLDKVTRNRFLEILQSGGDPLYPEELSAIVKCLKDKKLDGKDFGGECNSKNSLQSINQESDAEPQSEIDDLIPEIITEDIFFRDILCIEKPDEDLSSYVLRREDFKLKQELPTLEDFVSAVKENNLWQDLADAESN